jgi:putative flippase GtrA
MTLTDHSRREIGLALKFSAASCLGLLLDTAGLKIGLACGLSPATARLISLVAAMQVTFAINGVLVFRCLKGRDLVRQWTCYMGSNGVGNACNYAIFLGLIASRLPIVSDKLVALAIGALFAWAINFVGARIFAFGEEGLVRSLVARARGGVCAPGPAEAPDAAQSAGVLGQGAGLRGRRGAPVHALDELDADRLAGDRLA